jgi:hypothetical protein
MVEPLQNPLLGMLAHGAGVEQNDVRLLWTGRHTVAVGAQDAQHDLRVVEIHLAAVGLHVDQPCPVHRVHSGLWSGFRPQYWKLQHPRLYPRARVRTPVPITNQAWVS